MSRIVVFGAGGRAGRHAVSEAVSRGHRVTAVVRDPVRYQGLAAIRGVSVVGGDVTRPDSVAAAAGGHDAAINAAVPVPLPHGFFVDAARALLDGLARRGVGRLVVVGIGTTLETAPGIPLYTTFDFPSEGREFSVGHAAELAVLRDAETPVDWLVVAPPPTFLDEKAPRTGRYHLGGHQITPLDANAGPFSYADLAVALLDEIENPRHHRTMAGITHRAEAHYLDTRATA